MARTNSSKVQAVLGVNYDNETDLTAFIDTATMLVDKLSSCASDKDVTLSSAQLELIERWLAAHFYGHADQFYANRSTEGASGTFQGQTGMNLESTQYGQTAMMLDTSGCLRSFSKGLVRPSLVWLGKGKDDRIKLSQRGN